MQILYWHLTRPQTSTCGGSTSPPLLHRRDGTSLSAGSFSTEDKNSNSGINQSHSSQDQTARQSPLREASDAGDSKQSYNKNMEIENDDQTPTFYILNAVDVPVDDDAALNHHLDLIHGQNNGNSYNGPHVATGNGPSGDGGNGSGPPGGHYSNEPRKNLANKRKKRRSNDLARVLCIEDESEDESAVNIGPSKSKKAKLIVNLYPESQGYSFGYHVPGSNEASESHYIPYSERYLLDSIDAEQIPHKMLCKLEDREGVYLMRYRNQVIAEIRDYRKSMSAQSNSQQQITATISIPGRSSIALLPTPNGSSSLINGRVTGSESQAKPVVKQVMLRPTTESLLCDFDVLVEKGQQDRGGWNAVFRQSSSSGDVSHLVPDGSDSEYEYEVDLEASQKKECNYLTYDQRLELERKFVNQTAGPLCLDPSPQVSLIANRMQYEKFKWNTEEIKHAAKRWEENPFKNNKMTISTSDGSLNAPSLAEGRLDIEPFYNFVMNAKAKRELSSRTFGVDKDALRLPPIVYQDYPNLDPPKNIEEILRIGQIPEPAQLRVFPNENFVRKIEEYILETERRKRPHTTTLSIFQRNGMESYFGELEMESFLDPNQPRIGSPPASTKCQFELGSSRNVTLYVKQFSDIFTEDGRRPCKITYQKVGQPPQVVYTNSYKSTAPPTPPTAGNVASPSTPPPSQTITAVTASVPQIVTTIATPIVVNASPGVSSSVSVATPISATIVTSASQIFQAVAATSPGVTLPVSVTLPGIVSVTQQSGIQLQRPSTPASSTNIVVAGSGAASTATSAPSLPPVQIVHPQPRTTPQQQQQQQHQQKPQTSGQRQATVQIFSQQQAQSQNVTVPQSGVTPASASVNLNVNLTSPGITGITPQQVLTRPHIVNVNLQQQQQQAAAQQQLLQQLTQQRILRMKQQQPNTALAKLLLTNLQTKPITVAVQPTPQNPVNMASASSNSSSVCSSSANVAVSCSSSTNSNAAISNSSASNAIGSPVDQQQQSQQNPHGSPLMITSPPNASSAMTNPSPNVNVNVNASPSVSVNLNTISLDGLLAASSANVNYGNATLTTNQAGSSLVAASNVNLGLSRITTSSGQPAVNILRLNNSTGAVATAAGGNTVQLAAVQRQLAVSNAINGNVSILQQGSQQPQQRILINANSMNNLNLNSVGPSGEIDELSVPDLTTLLGGQPIQISQLGQQQHILTNATATTPSQTTIDTTNLNLNLNVNLNSGAVVNNGEPQVQQHQIAKIQGGEWTTTAQAPPFLVFISPLRPMSIATAAQAQTRQVATAGTVANPSALSLNLGTVQQQQQQIVQSQPGKVPEGPTRILLGTCNNGVAIKREVATSASTSSSAMTSATSSTGTSSDNLTQHNQTVEQTSLDTGTQLLDSQVDSSSDVVVDGVDSLFNALSEAIGPEQLQKLDAISGSLSAAASVASSNAAASQIPPSAVTDTTPSGMRVVPPGNAVNIAGSAASNINQSSSSVSSISNNCNSKSNNSTNVITLSDLLGSPTVVSSSAGSVNSYSPIILNSINNSSNNPGSSSNAINSSPTLSSLLNSVSSSMGGLPASSSVTSASVTQSSIVSSTPRLSALLAGTPSADTTVGGSSGPSSLLSSTGSADSSTGGANSASYGTLLDRLAASLNQPQGTTSQVRTGASRLNPIATATPSVVLDHPVLAATLTQQQPTSVSTANTVNRGSSTFRQIAPAPSPGSGMNIANASSIGNTSNSSSGNTVAVINASDVQSHAIQSPQLINLLGLVGNNTGGTGQPRTIRINANSPASNPSPSSASR